MSLGVEGCNGLMATGRRGGAGSAVVVVLDGARDTVFPPAGKPARVPV